MDISWEYNNRSFADGDLMRRLDFDDCHHESCPARMSVDDDENDDASIADGKHTRINFLTKVGSASSHTSTTVNSILLDEPHRITPRFLDSQEIGSRTTGRSTTKPVDNMPFCPDLPDDGTQSIPIQQRERFAQDSHKNLVDEYAVKHESTARQDFKACGKPKLQECTTGINENLLMRGVEFADSHRDSHSHNLANRHNESSHPNSQPHYSEKGTRTSKQILNSHKRTSGNYKSCNATTNMPSKVSAYPPRQRSRAIAIKRSRPGDIIYPAADRHAIVEKEDQRADVELYDFATWRMYNRIVDHRRRNPVRLAQQQVDDSQDGVPIKNDDANNPSNFETSSSVLEHNAGRGIVHPASILHGKRYFVHSNNAQYSDTEDSSYNEDDEIFDLEL